MIRNFLNRGKGTLLLALDPAEEIALTDRPALGRGCCLKNGVYDVMTC